MPDDVRANPNSRLAESILGQAGLLGRGSAFREARKRRFRFRPPGAAKFSCRYFVNGCLPPSCLQPSIAIRMIPMETMATRRRVARRSGWARVHTGQKTPLPPCDEETRLILEVAHVRIDPAVYCAAPTTTTPSSRDAWCRSICMCRACRICKKNCHLYPKHST